MLRQPDILPVRVSSELDVGVWAERRMRAGAAMTHGSGYSAYESGRSPSRHLLTTIELFGLIHHGDEHAREVLMGRYLPALRSWAHGRLPRQCRRLEDTDDIVQKAL